MAARVQLTATQLLAAQTALGPFARALRAAGIPDRVMAEWLLSLSVRWLHAHGVPRENVHMWAELEMCDASSPVPLVAAARAPSDFGAGR